MCVGGGFSQASAHIIKLWRLGFLVFHSHVCTVLEALQATEVTKLTVVNRGLGSLRLLPDGPAASGAEGGFFTPLQPGRIKG